YTINHTWISDIIDNSTTTLSESISSLAFMNNTNWITNSQKNLECILNVADDFYNLTKAALNKDKSKLLVTNFTSSFPVNLRFGSSHIDITSETESIHFLG
ncbi:12762_t:CDS:1, partial [Funneliformis geosporum]